MRLRALGRLSQHSPGLVWFQRDAWALPERLPERVPVMNRFDGATCGPALINGCEFYTNSGKFQHSTLGKILTDCPCSLTSRSLLSDTTLYRPNAIRGKPMNTWSEISSDAKCFGGGARSIVSCTPAQSEVNPPPLAPRVVLRSDTLSLDAKQTNSASTCMAVSQSEKKTEGSNS